MFKVGDKFTINGITHSHVHEVIAVAHTYLGHVNGVSQYGQMVQHPSGIWMADSLITKVNPE